MAEQKWRRKELDNLTELAELTEDTLLSSVKKRYDEGVVYTDLGDILVSVNPFREVPIYTEEWSRAYARPDVAHLPPHIFRSASRAFAAMFDCKKDQVFVISGESGAGKTESAKLLMRQVRGGRKAVTYTSTAPPVLHTHAWEIYCFILTPLSPTQPHRYHIHTFPIVTYITYTIIAYTTHTLSRHTTLNMFTGTSNCSFSNTSSHN